MKPDALPPKVRSPLLIWIGLGLLILALIATRVLPGWSFLVLKDGALVLPENDPYYHFRHAWYCLQHYPHLLRLDPFSHFPAVTASDAAGLYDVFLASLAKLVMLTGMDPERALGWVCLWFPPLGMAAILPLVYLRVRQHGSSGLALLTGLWVLLLPGLGLPKTSLGFCDHHVVEMLLGVVCIHLLVRLVVAERTAAGQWWRPAWGAALPLAAMQFSWLGAPLWLPLFALALTGQLVADVLGGVGSRPVLRAAFRFWLGFLIIVAALGLLWPGVVLVPWLWRATLLGTTTMLGLLPVVGWFLETTRWRLKPAARLLWAGGIALAAAGVLGVNFPVLRELLGDMLDRKSSLISENINVTWTFFFQATGLAGALAILAPMVGLLTPVGRRPGWWVAVLPSLGFVLLWMRTSDYGYQGSLHAVVLGGYFLTAVTSPSSRRWWIAGISTAVIALGVWPLRWTAPIWNPTDYYTKGGVFATPAWREAMMWLRTETPVPSDPPVGRVGVLTDWQTGNLVNTLGQRPSTSAGYPEAEGLRPLLALSETAARNAFLRGSTVAEAVRYVALEAKAVADSFGAHVLSAGLSQSLYTGQAVFETADHQRLRLPTLGPAYEATFAVRLFRHDGEGLAHFRLVYESRAMSLIQLQGHPQKGTLMAVARSMLDSTELVATRAQVSQASVWREGEEWCYQGQLLASVKLFEQVTGARLTGRVEPNMEVTLRLPLRLRTSGREFTYQQTIRAGNDGAFTLVCPYPTERIAGSDVEPTGPATLSWRTGQVEVLIPEAAVEKGIELIGNVYFPK